MFCIAPEILWVKNKCLIISTACFISMTIVTFSHRALSGSEWEGVETWETGDTSCHCEPTPLAGWNASTNAPKSLCGPSADLRGPGQRVLSFSLYGKEVGDNSDLRMKEYTEGIRGNVEDLRAHYPKGYTARVYHDKNWEENPGQMEDLCNVYCAHRDIMDLCPVRKLALKRPPGLEQLPLLPRFGMLWRFSPIADPLVTEFHSRDLDSRPTGREWAAVEEWLRSDRTYHVMRDHPNHKVAMLGGLWGMRFDRMQNDNGRREIVHIFEKMLCRGAKWFRGLDQDLLKEHLWPVAKKDMVAHDSWHCKWFESPMNQPWPVRRKMEGRNFVGSVTEKHRLTAECPAECRPRKHPEWTLC